MLHSKIWKNGHVFIWWGLHILIGYSDVKFVWCSLLMFPFSYCQSYASILYLRLPPDFRIILCREDVKHHNLVKDMMLRQKITYKPSNVAESAHNDSNVILFALTCRMALILDHINMFYFSTNGCQCDHWLCEGCFLSHRCSRFQCLP